MPLPTLTTADRAAAQVAMSLYRAWQAGAVMPFFNSKEEAALHCCDVICDDVCSVEEPQAIREFVLASLRLDVGYAS